MARNRILQDAFDVMAFCETNQYLSCLHGLTKLSMTNPSAFPTSYLPGNVGEGYAGSSNCFRSGL
jgi:hypothetical protein